MFLVFFTWLPVSLSRERFPDWKFNKHEVFLKAADSARVREIRVADVEAIDQASSASENLLLTDKLPV